MLQPFGEDIWIADGPVTATGGFRYGTRMVVIRLSDGGLFLWSPIPLSEPLRARIDDLGEVRHLVAPNALHHLFLGDWRRAYPAARLYAPPRWACAGSEWTWPSTATSPTSRRPPGPEPSTRWSCAAT